MIDEREAKLPQWAQQLIAELRKRVEAGQGILLPELARLRKRVHLLEIRNGAMRELLQCAANGGHLNSNSIIETIDGYDLELVKQEDRTNGERNIMNDTVVKKIIGMFRPCEGRFLEFNAPEVICGPDDRSMYGFSTFFPIRWLVEDFGFTEEEAAWFVEQVRSVNTVKGT